HKWFARRASCVFRAILLGCLKPLPMDENGKPTRTGAQVILDEFYRDHTHDPDTKDKVILDPFMGGGTTVVESLRLGCRVIGIDLNPVAWFIVKTEVEPVDLDALKNAFERLAERPVAWSGKSVRETLLSQYMTECPCCGAGREEADIIYTFWVKSAICTACKKQVPLFKDYLIAQKTPSIRYFRDARCPKCHKTFDWEIEPAALVAEPSLQINSPAYSAGVGRSSTRWAYSPGKVVPCPWCQEEVAARPSKKKPERKKVPLSVLLCPHCEAVWQWRGEVPDSVACPVCRKDYNPLVGNVPGKGEYLCSCGNRDDIIRSIRRLPEDQLLPIHPYAIEGYCAHCGGDEEEDEGEDVNGDLFEKQTRRRKVKAEMDHPCRITKSGGKFFKRVTPADLRRVGDAAQIWEREKARLPYPKQAVPDGQETHRLIEHHYRHWHQMFHPRQLLCLATLLEGIGEETDQALKEMLLSTFMMTTEANNLFTWQIKSRSTPGGMAPGGVFRRHDFAPKTNICEQNVWGVISGNNTFRNRKALTLEGVAFTKDIYDLVWDTIKGKTIRRPSAERFSVPGNASLYAMDARSCKPTSVDIVVTDPPYAGNVNYAELSDFFYVWLRLLLIERYPEFAPDETPKSAEIIENPIRGKTAIDFGKDLTEVFKFAGRNLSEAGILAFTFHHAEGSAWEALLASVCDAGFCIESVYPIHAEREQSLHLLDTQSISYDLIHVCKKRDLRATREPRSWAGIRQEIRRRAREEIAAIEAGRYGNEPLSPSDVNIVLIGKCLELYSRHYGAVVDHEGKGVPLHEALKQIRDIADQMTERERPLPSELEDIDPESRVYLRALCAVREVKSDEVHKATRGVMEPSDLIDAGLMIKGRAGRGRSYEVKQPAERLTELMERFGDGATSPQVNLFGEVERPKEKRGTLFIDRVHLLLGLVEAGENVVPWLDRFRGDTPQIRAALEYLEARNRGLAPACRKVLDMMEIGPLFKGGV
ncbi:MAG: hypothetical protein A3F84_24320, partial [Candidatus Handelsmanbacteria bacterium RIFCSPLOWO2_12_FULL_64_10]